MRLVPWPLRNGWEVNKQYGISFPLDSSFSREADADKEDDEEEYADEADEVDDTDDDD